MAAYRSVLENQNVVHFKHIKRSTTKWWTCVYLLSLQVFLSTRTGAWVHSRSSVGGYPLNMMQTRWRNFLLRVLPSRFVSWNQERQMNKIFNHENYGLSIAKGYLTFLFHGKASVSFNRFYCYVYILIIGGVASTVQSQPPFFLSLPDSHSSPTLIGHRSDLSVHLGK